MRSRRRSLIYGFNQCGFSESGGGETYERGGAGCWGSTTYNEQSTTRPAIALAAAPLSFLDERTSGSIARWCPVVTDEIYLMLWRRKLPNQL